MLLLTSRAAQAMDQAIHALLSKASMGMSPISLTLAWSDWLLHLAVSPGRLGTLAQLAAQLVHTSTQAQLGALDNSAAQQPAEVDDRFGDPLWRRWPFEQIRSGFLASSAWWKQASLVDGMARHNAHLVEFFTRQWLDALSPANWPATNPQVLTATLASGGQNLLNGGRLLVRDLVEQQARRGEQPPGTLSPLPFAVGTDVAVTPGKVVFRNHLIELIRYESTTATVHPEPVLIVPSCIMKYYILDLSPRNSMVRHLVDQGHVVYMISWRNPDVSDRDLGMHDYLHSGVMAAMAAIQAGSGADYIHAVGYCLGGTFLAIVAAALGGHDCSSDARSRTGGVCAVCGCGLPKFRSVTLLATLTDFTEPGELGVFIDDDQLRTLREEMAHTGFLSGRQMAGSFQFLNSRDLIWARNVRRYLLGQDSKPNDLMSWNTDVTRLPERMHSEYLQSLYLNNALAAGRYRVGNTAVALGDIQAPLFVVGTARDHVAPWRSVYKIHLLTDTHITFVLASGGHNAGIVSEPGHPHRSYQIASMEHGHRWVDPEEWAAQVPLHQGSWWEAWQAWLVQRSGPRVAATPIPADTVIGEAPGQYVHVRYAD
ncbi:PHA/PHB synthase family protein [Azohydromonas lata]|uniref:PHA/PHB synthase family protein n=1 Tax=Azohydromonas lata TaxID=45677 RepID=UPI0009FFA105|nr:alpha/beta fold hydrolase [Azohydromonas lata]